MSRCSSCLLPSKLKADDRRKRNGGEKTNKTKEKVEKLRSNRASAAERGQRTHKREEILSHVREMPLGALAGATLVYLVHEVTDPRHQEEWKKGLLPYTFSSGRLLSHSMTVAIGAAQLAEGLHMEAPHYLFTAGLVHDIGKAVLDAVVGADLRSVHQLSVEEKIPMDQAERKLLGIDHAEAGANFLSNWQMAASVIDAVRWHHQPDSCPCSQTAVDLIHVADALCSSLSLTCDEAASLPSRHALARLGLDQRDAEGVLCKVLGRMEELQVLLAQSERKQDEEGSS